MASTSISAPVEVRRALSSDVPAVHGLVGQHMEEYRSRFGTVNVAVLIETAFMSLIASVQGRPVAFLSLTDAPATPGLDGDVATQYLREVCGQSDVQVSVMHVKFGAVGMLAGDGVAHLRRMCCGIGARRCVIVLEAARRVSTVLCLLMLR